MGTRLLKQLTHSFRKNGHLGQRLRGPKDLAREAVMGLTLKPSRTTLTVLVTLLSVASLGASLGLTTTERAAVNTSYIKAVPTFIEIADTEPTLASSAFPPGSTTKVDSLPGVKASGILWDLQVHIRTNVAPVPSRVSPVEQSALSALAASPGLFRAAGSVFVAGSSFNAFDLHHNERVAIVGATAAKYLGINQESILAGQSVLLNGLPFTVMGVLQSVANEPSLMTSVIVPTTTAIQLFGRPKSGSQIDVLTQPGASALIAREVPVALHPYNPTRLQSLTYTAPVPEARQINSDLGSLLVVIGVVGLFVGLISIMSVMLITVLERKREIGIRRAIGASRTQIAVQFALESTAIGTVGGILGTVVGLFVVSIFSLSHHLVPVVDPSLVLPDPLIGSIIGLVAGAYPALKAAWFAPVQAITG